MRGLKPTIIEKNTKLIDLGCINDIAVFLDDELITPARRDGRLCNYFQTWLNYKGKICFFKTMDHDNLLIAELLGEKVSQKFELETIHYNLASGYIKTSDKEITVYGVLSEWARKENVNYSYLKSRFPNSSFSVSDIKIIDYLEERCSNQPLVNQFKSFLIRELYTKELDRLPDELLIAETHSIISLGYLLDYEMEFNNMRKNPRIKADGLYGFSFTDIDFLKKVKKDPVLKEYINLSLKIDLLKLLKEIQEETGLRLYKKSCMQDQTIAQNITEFQEMQRLEMKKVLDF